MVIELKSEQLRVQFNSFGGALSSIKMLRDLSICGKEMLLVRLGQAPVLLPHLGSLREDTAFI